MTLLCGVRVHIDTLLTENGQLTDYTAGALDKLMRTQTKYGRHIPVSYVSRQPFDKVQKLISENELPVPTLIAAGDVLVVSNDLLSLRPDDNDYLSSRANGIDEYSMVKEGICERHDIWNDGKELIVQKAYGPLDKLWKDPKPRLGLEEGLAAIVRSQNYYDDNFNSSTSFPIFRDKSLHAARTLFEYFHKI